MRRAQRILLAMPLATVGCWSQPFSTATESYAAPPPKVERKEKPAPTRPVATREVAPIESPAYTPPRSVWRRLENGPLLITQSEVPAPEIGGQVAILRLTLPAGTRSFAPGLTELTAWSQVEVKGDARPSLREMIEGLGGTLSLRVGSTTTSLQLVIGEARWAEALAGLIFAVQASPPAGSSFLRLQARLVRQRQAELTGPGLNSLLDRVTRLGGLAAGRYVEALEDRTAEEVEVCHRRAFDPRHAVLALWVPGVEAGAVLDRAETLAHPWKSTHKAPARPPAPKTTPGPLPGLFWSPGEGPGEVALVFAAPRLGTPEDLASLLCLQSFTDGGLGGRLGAAWPKGALRGRFHEGGDLRYLVLRTTLAPARVLSLWRAVAKARASFVAAPPTGEELARAVKSLRLRILAEQAEPMTWLDVATARALHADEPIDWRDLLIRLEHPEVLPLANAATAFGKGPTTMLGSGGTPPQAAAGIVTMVGDATLQPRKKGVPVSPPEQEEAARKLLEVAMQAVGGERFLQEMQGYHGRRIQRSKGGGEIEEQIWFRAPDRLRRVRKILATRIETVLARDRGREQSGDKRVQLDPAESKSLLRAAARHPLLLLAAYARGKLHFRLVSYRNVGGRELAMLEALDAEQRGLRIGLDAQSGLIRLVEWRLLGKTEKRQRMSFSDYRRVGGLRAPFHVVSTSRGLTRDWQEFLGEAPSDQMLAPGGPMH